MLTWADVAIHMYMDRSFGSLTAQDVRSLIDWIDERPELARKLEEFAGESLRRELALLALEVREVTPSPFRVVKSRASATR